LAWLSLWKIAVGAAGFFLAQAGTITPGRDSLMKHRHNHFAVGYWSRIKGSRSVPDQADIDPKALKRLLSQVFLLDMRGPFAATAPYRLAGTALCERMGGELRGKSFLAHWDEGSRRALGVLLRQSLRLAAPVCLTSIGSTADCRMVEIETVLMPITYHGGEPERLLGVTQVLGDASQLAGRMLAFERLVSSTMLHKNENNAYLDEPPGFGDGPGAEQPLSRTPHLRLVVSRGDHSDPLRFDLDAMSGLFASARGYRGLV
jgi:hypothetical protein